MRENPTIGINCGRWWEREYKTESVSVPGGVTRKIRLLKGINIYRKNGIGNKNITSEGLQIPIVRSEQISKEPVKSREDDPIWYRQQPKKTIGKKIRAVYPRMAAGHRRGCIVQIQLEPQLKKMQHKKSVQLGGCRKGM